MFCMLHLWCCCSYLNCFFYAEKSLLMIAELPRPDSMFEQIFQMVNYLFGAFFMSIILGQVASFSSIYVQLLCIFFPKFLFLILWWFAQALIEWHIISRCSCHSYLFYCIRFLLFFNWTAYGIAGKNCRKTSRGSNLKSSFLISGVSTSSKTQSRKQSL